MSKRFFFPKREFDNYVTILVKLHNNQFSKVTISKDILGEKNAAGQYSAEHDVLRDKIISECLSTHNVMPLFACGVKVNFNS